MPTFKAPSYSKKINPSTGLQEPTYIFNIIFTDSDTKLIATEEDNSSPVSLKTLQECILGNVDWWNTFIGDFLIASSKHFAKPYTIDNINKIAKHTLSGESQFIETPYSITFTPINIQISQGNFIVNWTFVVEPIVISIPDFEETSNNTLNSLPDSTDINNIDKANKENILGLEELDMNNIPVDKDLTGTELKIGSQTKHYDKQRAKEAKLRAKLAIYKAERIMTKYYEKYGEDVSDMDSDSDSDESYSESETEYEDDVQL
jgi:hypothetical protein